ncbi:probable flavin-containing monoamine oxidase A [Xenia sp. Carnegie-2017]|uniref:probable flavin-containing monoamine oxidase A n=1 Tax=Xenia sp. Carnegie-2017 TaxID=2897299 RepID=UPI001F04274C|nr:probable flavin-containing monoamine oxidase A [Xenia sp. Carnegie-2017]
MEAYSCDVTVIGAGVSGLTAAYDISKKRHNCKIIVLEARDRVGGRLCPVSLNVQNGKKELFDLGGQWVCRRQNNICKLIERFKLQTYKQYTKGSKLIEINPGDVTSTDDETSSLGFITSMEIFLACKKIENMCKHVPLDKPEKAPNAKDWDGMTVETFKNQTLWTRDAKKIFDITVSAMFGLSPSQISLLFFLHFCNTCGGFQSLLGGGTQEMKVKGGLHQICTSLQNEIGKENILLTHAVTSIQQDDDMVKVHTSNGKCFQCKHCIIATPSKLVDKIEFSPPLPYERRILTQQIIMGCFTKFVATYKTSFWRQAGLSGQLTRYTNSKESAMSSPVGLVKDAVTSENNPALVGFFTGYGASLWAAKSDEEKKHAALETLKSFFGSKAENPLDFAIKDWCLDEWSGSCSVAVMTPGGITQFGDILKKPFKRIHWAGTDLGSTWRGYVDGAVESGFRAAKEVLEKI